MNNEPVAYFAKDEFGWWAETDKESGVPFYTHPAKTLTDEEILELTKDSTIFEYREFDDDMVRFARAILRKAQEK